MSIAESLAFASSARVAQNLYIYISGHFDYGGRRRADATSASVAQSWRRRRGARHTGTRITCFTGTQVQILTPYVRAPQLVGTDIKLPSKPTDAGEQLQASESDWELRGRAEARALFESLVYGL